MRIFRKQLQRRLVWLLVCFSAGTPTSAQAEETLDNWSIDATVSAVTDYRFRGYSLSNHKPAVQPELWIAHKSGLYAGVWGSNVADLGGDGIELDPSIGYASSSGSLEFDISATYYFYPGASEFNYIELASKISTAAGPARVGIELGYAPAQDNIGGVDNRYASAFASVPLGSTQVSLDGTFGIEDGAFGDGKIDWSLGVSTKLRGFTLSAHYVDAARHGGSPLAEPTIIAAIAYTF